MFALRRIAKFGPQREPIRIFLFIGDQFSTVQLYNNNKYILHFVAQLSKVKVAMTNLIPSPCNRNQDSECSKNIRDSEPHKFG